MCVHLTLGRSLLVALAWFACNARTQQNFYSNRNTFGFATAACYVTILMVMLILASLLLSTDIFLPSSPLIIVVASSIFFFFFFALLLLLLMLSLLLFSYRHLFFFYSVHTDRQNVRSLRELKPLRILMEKRCLENGKSTQSMAVRLSIETLFQTHYHIWLKKREKYL